MKRALALFCLAAALIASPAHADNVTLRPRVEASGPAILLGEVFDGAGSAAGRAIAPAPPPGQTTTLSTAVLAAAASAAGFEWTPPANATGVRVTRASGMRATVAPAGGTFVNNGGMRTAVADAAIRRGEPVLLMFSAPGVQLSTRARALEDGAVGQSIRLVNLASNRTVDATVTGPGAASASFQ